MKPIIALTLAMALAACSPRLELDAPAAWCAHNEPRDWSVATVEAMTPEERREEEEYHQRGVKWCGWQP